MWREFHAYPPRSVGALPGRTIRPGARERPKRSAGRFSRSIRTSPTRGTCWGSLPTSPVSTHWPSSASAARSRPGRKWPIIAAIWARPIKLSGSWMRPWPATAKHCSSKPEFAEAHYNLGNVVREQGDIDGAEACYRRSLLLKPDYAKAHNNLGNVLLAQGNLDEAIASYRRALAIRPNDARAHSNALYAAQLRHGCHVGRIVGAARSMGCPACRGIGRDVAPARKPAQSRAAAAAGILVAGSGLPSGGLFPDPHDRSPCAKPCETICYSDRVQEDELTRRFQESTCVWREVHSLSDEALAEQIRADSVDILFDLFGHTARSRLLVFARKPAPIQATWIGYVGTTGLAAMDYLIADRFQVAEGTEAHYREKILRLPDSYVCLDPPADAPAVGPLPAVRQGHVTFGSFNKPAKINPLVVQAWAAILRRVPRSRLVIRHQGFEAGSVRRRYESLFAGQGIESDRLELLGRATHADLLSEYQRIDLALDPFPYSGGLTTCEALWMGVPVITCPGETFASRHALSHLSNVGFPGTVAPTCPSISKSRSIGPAICRGWRPGEPTSAGGCPYRRCATVLVLRPI